jgi:hypothetical protein
MVPLLTEMEITSQRRFLNNVDSVAVVPDFRNEGAKDVFTVYLVKMEKSELTEEQNDILLFAAELASDLSAVKAS